MSDLFDRPGVAKAKAPESGKIASVTQLYPDGIFIRTEARLDGDVYWVGKRRGAGSRTEVVFDMDELEDLYLKLQAFLGIDES